MLKKCSYSEQRFVVMQKLWLCSSSVTIEAPSRDASGAHGRNKRELQRKEWSESHSDSGELRKGIYRVVAWKYRLRGDEGCRRLKSVILPTLGFSRSGDLIGPTHKDHSDLVTWFVSSDDVESLPYGVLSGRTAVRYLQSLQSRGFV